MDQKLYLGVGLAVALALGVGGGVWALQGEKPEKAERKAKIEAEKGEKSPDEAVVVTPPPEPAPAGGGGRIAVRYLDVPMEQITAFEAEHGYTLASEIPQLHVRVLAVPDIDAALALYEEHTELAKYAEKETGVTTN